MLDPTTCALCGTPYIDAEEQLCGVCLAEYMGPGVIVLNLDGQVTDPVSFVSRPRLRRKMPLDVPLDGLFRTPDRPFMIRRK